MELDRRRVLWGYGIALLGFVLAFFVASALPTPSPPACYTWVCNTAEGATLAGLAGLLIGLYLIGSALFRSSRMPPPPPAVGPKPQYSFGGTPAPPPGSAPAPLTPLPSIPPAGAPVAPAPTIRHCPGCGASVTSEYGFCPRCGRTLTP